MKAEIPVFSLHQGQSPLLVSIPHAGTHLPSWLLPRLTPHARQLAEPCRKILRRALLPDLLAFQQPRDH